MDKELNMDPELRTLWEQMVTLRSHLRDYTWKKYKKVNPFMEDLFDWKEKGSFFGGKNVTIYDSAFVNGDVSIGDNTWIGPYCIINGMGGLTIGKYCSVAAGVKIHTHDTIKWALSEGKMPYEYKPVSIGDGCFIGVNSVITCGVSIGDHCLIAAGSVVTKDIPSNHIIAGVPAKIIGTVKISEKSEITLIYQEPQ